MSIEKAIREAFKQKKEREWDTIYFAIDLHGTILLPHQNNVHWRGLHPYAFETLKLLSNQHDIVLILFTATKKKELQSFYKFCKMNNINFKYLNENTECKNTKTGDYKKKFYFNVLLDDRAGFDPKDWHKIFNICFDEITRDSFRGCHPKFILNRKRKLLKLLSKKNVLYARARSIS